MKAKMLSACLALCAGAASAATSYVVPWEVNPTLVARVPVLDASGAAVTNVTPLAVDVSADGAWLAASAASAADGARGVMAVCLADLASLSGGALASPSIAGAAASLGLSSPLVLATGDGGGATLALDPSSGTAKRLPNGGAAYQAWTRRQAPKAVAVTGAAFASAAAFALAPDGATAVSCAAEGGTLTTWTLDATALAAAGTIDTGLSKISSVAVYTVGKPAAETKTTYAVIGEASASAATKGRVALVNLATGDVTTLLDDAGRFGGGIVAVRMSRTDTYRPRLYVLTADGAIFCHYLTEDLATVTASYAYTNAELLTAAGAPFADAAAARVTAFDVSPDGGTLALGYARTDASAAPTDAMAVAVLRHTARRWRHYAAGEAGNPSTNDVECISDGRWALRWGWATGGIRVGKGTTKTGDVITDYGNGYVNDCRDEFLDLSYGSADLYENGKYKEGHPIVGNTNYGLGTTGLDNAWMPRVVLHSPACRNPVYHNGWDGVEEIVYKTTGVANVPKWSGFPASVKRVVLDMDFLYVLNENGLYGASDAGKALAGGVAPETDLTTDVSFPKVNNVLATGFALMAATGTLDLPAVTNLANYACKEMTGMTGLRLSAEAKTLKAIGQGAFTCQETLGFTGALERVTIGGVDGFSFNTYAFNAGGSNKAYQRKIAEVTFTGGVPAYTANGDVYVDAAERTMWFSVPKGHAGWAAALAGQVTALTDEERQAVRTAHPDRPLPFGVVAKGVFRTKFPQYVCYVDDNATYRVTVEHDAFFGDGVEVTSDVAPAPDGSYLVGTTLTLTPKASATGTFTKWYGDVPGGASADSPLTLVVTNDVWLYARFVHPWTLAADSKTASNGNFTVNVSGVYPDSRSLTLGANVAGGLFADADDGEGVLDLGGEVRDTAGNAWTFAFWRTPNGFFVRTKNGKGNVSTLLTPGTLADGAIWSPYQAFHVGQLKDANRNGIGQASYRMVVVDEPKMAGQVVGWTFAGQDNLTKVIFRAPRLGGFIGEHCFVGGTNLSETRFDWWDLSGATNVAAKALLVDNTTAVSASGTLRLPSMRSVPKEVTYPNTSIKNYALGKFPNAEGLAFGGLTRRTTVTDIGDRALALNASLKTLTIHNAPDMTVGETPFTGGLTPAEITFTGKAIKDGGAALGNLLAGVTAAATKPVVVYASWRQGWDSLDYIDRDLTDDELAQVPEGETALGVFRGGAEAPLGKALVIQRPSPYDPRGSLFILR